MTSLVRRNPLLPSFFGEDVWSPIDRMFSSLSDYGSYATKHSGYSFIEDENGYNLKVTLPEGTTAEQIQAEVKNGVLSVVVAKIDTPATPIEVTDKVE